MCWHVQIETAHVVAGQHGSQSNTKMPGNGCNAVVVYGSASTGWMNTIVHACVDCNATLVQGQNKTLTPENEALVQLHSMAYSTEN